MNSYKHHTLSANGLVALLLGCWWMLNVLTCCWLDLANDEAYYWAWTTAASENGNPLAWGYFDHPPMVALLIWLSSWLPGTLGVRFFSLLLQPLYLYLFWTLIRPPQPSRKDAWIYSLVSFSIPMLQLYGLLTLPDAPLLCFTIVFLWALKQFDAQRTLLNATLLAVAMALLVYSKYHGVLVILLALAACIRKGNSPFRCWQLYYAGVLAVILFLPHLWWQYRHDFATFQYHLVERSGDGGFDWENIGGFLVTIILVYNPIWWFFAPNKPLQQQDLTRRILLFILAGFIAFFFLSSLKDNTQAQWTLPILITLIVWGFDAARESERKYHIVRTCAIVSGILLMVARILMVSNPWEWKLETWQQQDSFDQIAALADGRPVLYSNDYTGAAEYCYYGKEHQAESFAFPIFYGRESQWSYSLAEEKLVGRDVVVQVEENRYADTLLLDNGEAFEYVTINNYHPTRKVRAEIVQTILHGNQAEIEMIVTNPYDYDLYSTEENPMIATLYWRECQRVQPEIKTPLTDTLHAHSSKHLHMVFELGNRRPKDFPCGICIGYALFRCNRSSEIFFLDTK